MNKLQEIEKSLVAINEAKFQNVCDELLYNTIEDYPNIDTIGSTIAKQKTRKGTPDSYFILPNGKYVLVEYTTKDALENKKAFIQKATSDILKCLNESKTKIKHGSIDRIIFCHNSKLTTAETNSLNAICNSKGVKLDIMGLSKIAFSLTGRCKYIAKEYLGISIDSGQILPPETFIKEYENGGFATTLSNKLYGREAELPALIDDIKTKRITILSGPPGVGKSKLVLEALKSLKKQNRKLTVYCLSNKSAPIHDDLRSYLSEDKPYVVFVDDGNRQSGNFRALLGILNEVRKHKIHVVVTVRDYALQGIIKDCAGFDKVERNLNKLNDEKIDEILKGEDFNISSQIARYRIGEVCKGIPRLAIMAAKVLQSSQDLSSLDNVYNLYDVYFSNAISSDQIFTDAILLKTIGLLSFFYSINLQNDVFLSNICRLYSIDETSFRVALTKLEEWELIELNTDYSVARISDQVLSTYFFYRTFLKDKVLSFDILIHNYFEDYTQRFNDTVIAANSTFGHDEILKDIDPYLTTYWSKIRDSSATAIKFLKMFWLYRHEDVLEYADDVIAAIPVTTPIKYVYNKDARNRSLAGKDDLLLLLSNCFEEIKFSYLDALELAFSYVIKVPGGYQQLQDALIEYFAINSEDLANHCTRQKGLLKFLFDNSKNGELYLEAFFNMLPTLLSKSFRPYNPKHSGSRLRSYRRVNPIDTVSELRQMIWDFILKMYKSYQTRFYEFLLGYVDENRDGVMAVYEYDLPFLMKIFRKHFTTSSLEDVYLVQHISYRLKKFGVKAKECKSLSDEFMSPDYETFLVLNHNRIRDKEERDFANSDDYLSLKTEEVRKNFNFKTLKEFRKFYKTFKQIALLQDRHISSVFASLDIIVHKHAENNPALALSFLKETVDDNNPTTFYPRRVLSIFMEDINLKFCHDYYALIKGREFLSKEFWLWFFYCELPSSKVNPTYSDDLLKLIATVQSKLYIKFFVFEKFSKVKDNFYILALDGYLNNKKNTLTQAQLDVTLFENYFPKYLSRIDLLKQAYFVSDDSRNYFDHDFKYFLKVVELDNSFFMDYITSIVNESVFYHSKELEHISIVWQLGNAESLIEGVLNYLLSRRVFFISDEINTSFFKNVQPDNEDRIVNFFRDYLNRNINDSKKVSFVFYCVRNFLPKYLQDFILLFLSLNTDFEAFKKIELNNDHFSVTGIDTIWADIRAEELQTVLDAIETISVKKFKYNKHRNYLKEWIKQEKIHANEERKRKFLFRDWL